MRPQTVRRVAPLAVGVLVLLVIAGVWAVRREAGGSERTTPGDGGTSPAVLALVGWTAVSGPVDPRYHLSPGADLPAGPGSAPVHRLDPADAPAAVALTGSSVERATEPAAGWLQRGSDGPAYPLVTARQAYDALVRTPLPMPLMACPELLPPDADPVPCGGPVTVTGARLGLAVQQSAEETLLVPAWLFQVAGSPQPLVRVAVDPALLVAATGRGGGSGSSGGGTVSGGVATVVPPAGPSTDPGTRFTSVARSADDRSLEVRFYGGVQECYSYDVVAGETDRAVRLTVVEHRSAGDKPCIDLAVEITKTVHLAATLGLREVVDADTGTVVLGPTR